MQDKYFFKLLTFLADEIFHGSSPTFTRLWPHLEKFYDRVLRKTTFTTNRSKFFKRQLGCSECSSTLRTQPRYTLKSHNKKVSNIYG